MNTLIVKQYDIVAILYDERFSNHVTLLLSSGHRVTVPAPASKSIVGDWTEQNIPFHSFTDAVIRIVGGATHD